MSAILNFTLKLLPCWVGWVVVNVFANIKAIQPSLALVGARAEPDNYSNYAKNVN